MTDIPDRPATPQELADATDYFAWASGITVYQQTQWGQETSQDFGDQLLSRSVFVIGVMRSGTSLVAGVLHTLGCTMYQRPSKRAAMPEWTFEDQLWVTTGLLRNDDPWTLPAHHARFYADLIRKNQTSFPLWGIKEPRLMFVMEKLLPVLEDPRFIFVHRPTIPVQRSWDRIGTGALEAPSLTEQYQAVSRCRFLAEEGVPAIHVIYEGALEEPAAFVGEIADFAFGGTGVPVQPQDVIRAVRFIDPSKRHF